MKAEHRHQLHTNVLADRMGRVLQGMKSAPKTTSTLIWVFVLLALGTFAVWRYAASSTLKDRSQLWTRVDEITHDSSLWNRVDRDSKEPLGALKLQELAVENAGTIPVRAARFELARWHLRQGMEALTGSVRSDALPHLKRSKELYTELVPQCVDVPLLTQEAMMGMGTAEEALAGLVESAPAVDGSDAASSEPGKEERPAGSLKKAVEYYRDLASKHPQSILGKKAAERANELEQQTSQVEQFYAAANQKPALKAIPPIPIK
jgi:hypothetical protein